VIISVYDTHLQGLIQRADKSFYNLNLYDKSGDKKHIMHKESDVFDFSTFLPCGMGAVNSQNFKEQSQEFKSSGSACDTLCPTLCCDTTNLSVFYEMDYIYIYMRTQAFQTVCNS